MSTVLVTGGTGHLGRCVVDLLVSGGHEVRLLARSPGTDPRVSWVRGDLATGAGVAEAVAGVESVVHAATWSPAARRGYLLPVDLVRTPPDVDVEGTRRLLAEAERTGVGHFLHVSIVGLQQVRLPYARIKLAAEGLVRSSPVPWSIVPATGFHWLWHRMLTKQLRLPVWTLPRLLVQPVDSDDFGEYVVECLTEGAGGDRDDFAGPETLTLVDLGHQFLGARGERRPLIPIPVPEKFAQVAGGLTGPDARLGTTTWSEWLRRHPADER
ncbi:MAG: SDR family oxidoreductase [Nocardioides sp.]